MEADFSSVVKDFDAVQDMKGTLVRLVQEQYSGSSALLPNCKVYREKLEDGRSLVVFFPNTFESLVKASVEQYGPSTTSCPEVRDESVTREGANRLSAEGQPKREMYFVAFVGSRKSPLREKDLPMSVWDAEEGLRPVMSSIAEMLAYVSCERTPGGDWSNFVLFTKRDVVDRWSASPLHTFLVNEFSPLYYSEVRIHRGELEHGLMESSIFCLERTLFLHFLNEESDQGVQRYIKYWNKTEHTSPVPWVAVKS